MSTWIKGDGKKVSHTKCRYEMLKWIDDYELIAVWRRDNPLTFRYTWESYTTSHIYCRLDFVLALFGISPIFLIM